MSSYGSGRKPEYQLTTHYRTINVESARVFGYQIVYTEQKNIVGKRPWIICPFCQRRCRLLYFRLKDIPLCRVCLHLIYPSQRSSYEEKQKTYERYILEEGAYEEWERLPKRYLSYEEARYHYNKWTFKMMRELLKLQIETARLCAQMLPIEKQIEAEAKITALEREDLTFEEVSVAIHEMESLVA